MPDLSPFETAMEAAWVRTPSNFELLSLSPLVISTWTMSALVPSVDEIPGTDLLSVAKAVCTYPDHDSEGAYAAALQNTAGSLGLTLDQVTTLANRALAEIRRYPWDLPIPVCLLLIQGGCRGGANQLY